jgi:hypothetical protein
VLSYGISYDKRKGEERTWWQNQPASSFEKSPGPTDYQAKGMEGPGGGRFNLSNPKSDVEWKMYTAAKLPGPGQYDMPTLGSGVSGGRFNLSRPKGIIDDAIYKASRDRAAPNSYNAQEDLKKKRGGRVYSKPASKVTSVDVQNLHQMWNSINPNSTILRSTEKTFKSNPTISRPRQRQAPPQPEYLRSLTAARGHQRQLTKSGLLIIRPNFQGPRMRRK